MLDQQAPPCQFCGAPGYFATDPRESDMPLVGCVEECQERIRAQRLRLQTLSLLTFDWKDNDSR